MNSGGKSIVLIGMMGAGKSSVGRCLQQRTKLTLLDTDDIVAAKFGISIPEIFSKYGEQAFRESETQALRELAPAKQAIIVTGGGIVLREQNANFLRQLGIVVWLQGNKETLFERASRVGTRPLLQGKNHARRIRANATGAAATLCQSCTYSRRYIGAYRRRGCHGHFK